MKTLFDAGVDVNETEKYGRMSIHDAAWAGLKEAILLLLDSGVDVNATDKNGRMPIHYAIQALSKDPLPFLLGNIWDHINVINARAKLKDAVLLLFDRGADVNATEKDGQTPLHDAAQTGSREAVRMLLPRGADVNAIDKDGRMPLHDAARTGSEDAVLLLLDKGLTLTQLTIMDGRLFMMLPELAQKTPSCYFSVKEQT